MRIRDLVAVLIGLGVLGVVGFVGWQWLETGTEEPPDPRQGAEELAAEYVAAWNDGDHAAMRELVEDPPEDFAAQHEQLLEGTGARDLEVRAEGITHPTQGRAVVTLGIEVHVAELDEALSWSSEAELLRARGRWRLAWTISTLHPELRPTWEFGRQREDVGRRDILAVDGTPLAGTGEAVTFGFQPALVEDPEDVVEAFAAAFPGSETTAKRELARDDLNDDWFYPVVRVGADRAAAAAPDLRGATGVLRRTDGEARTLFEEGFARHTVGIVDEATAEQLEELGEEYEAGDEIGQFGLEARFEDELLGSDVVRVGLVESGTGTMRHVIAEGQQRASRDITTTIDVDVQLAVERALAGVEAPSAMVVVDGADGAVRGVASRPLSGYHRALAGRYPPGSTFKIVTAEAALASGATIDDTVSCPAETIVGGLRVPNSGGRAFGETTLKTAFAESCNTTFARLATDLGADEVTAASERFGFGVAYDLPLETFGGEFPEPADTAELAAAAFGQARVQASVLHMASVAAAVTSGTWNPPYLIVDETDATDEAPRGRRLATGATEPLRALLRAAVAEGTGAPADVDGTVSGKTGTAQGRDGTEHAWFVGTWRGYGFAVLVEDGGSGGEVAAPLARRFVRELTDILGRDDTDSGADSDTDDG